MIAQAPKECVACRSLFVRGKNESFAYFESRRFCSAKCWHSLPKPKGSNHPSWKGGIYKTTEGYLRYGASFGKQLVHRAVMEKMLGRPMLPMETVHHKNGIKTDNRPENLELRTGNHGKGATHHCPTCICDRGN